MYHQNFDSDGIVWLNFNLKHSFTTEATVKTCSSTKRKADDHLESTRKKSAGELRPNRSKAAESLGPKENKPGSKSLGQTNKRAPERLVHSREQSSNEDKDVTKETFSALRIVKPLISSVAMEKKMEGRRFVKVSQIPSKIKGQDIEGDWVTIGVMVQKLPPKKSSNVRTDCLVYVMVIRSMSSCNVCVYIPELKLHYMRV